MSITYLGKNDEGMDHIEAAVDMESVGRALTVATSNVTGTTEGLRIHDYKDVDHIEITSSNTGVYVECEIDDRQAGDLLRRIAKCIAEGMEKNGDKTTAERILASAMCAAYDPITGEGADVAIREIERKLGADRAGSAGSVTLPGFKDVLSKARAMFAQPASANA